MIKRTPEERKEWYKTMSNIARRVKAMNEEERQAMLAKVTGGCILTCEGHPLTMFNTLFLATQASGTERPIPTMVGGYQQWTKVGRYVRSGEHAIGYIHVPIMAKAKTSGEESDDVESRVRFRLVPVFDITQTEEGYKPGDVKSVESPKGGAT